MNGLLEAITSLRLLSWQTAAWLGGILGVLLLLLYFLKLRRRPTVVSSTLLWAQALEDYRVNHPFRWLRTSLLLLLQALVLAALIAGIGRLVVRGAVQGERSIIVLMDRSASMSAIEADGRSRLEHARDVARDIAADMSAGDRAMLVSFAAQTHVESAWSNDAGELLRAIDAVSPSDAPTNPSEALRIASAAHRTGGGARRVSVVMISDGRYDPALGQAFSAGREEGGAFQQLDLTYVRVGETSENWGIVAFDARPRFRFAAKEPASNAGGYRVFARVRNFSNKKGRRTISLMLGGRYHRSVALSLKPGEDGVASFGLSADATGVVAARIDGTDALAADNTARAVLAPRRARRVLLCTTGNTYLERALDSDPTVELVVMKPHEIAARIAASTFDPARWTCVVLDGFIPAGLGENPPGAYLVFDIAPPVKGYEKLDINATSRVVDWDSTHPANRYVDFSGLHVASRRKVRVPPGAHALLESDDGPLISAYQKEELAVVAVHFNLFKSDWAVQRSFPVFLSNVVEWLEEIRGNTGGRFVRTGSVGRFETATPRRAGEVVRASLSAAGKDRPVNLRLSKGRVHPLTETERAGVLTFTIAGGEHVIAVNLLDAEESNIAPRDEIVFAQDTGAARAVAAGSLSHTDQPLWPWLAGIALVVALVEWRHYHRRTLG